MHDQPEKFLQNYCGTIRSNLWRCTEHSWFFKNTFRKNTAPENKAIVMICAKECLVAERPAETWRT